MTFWRTRVSPESMGEIIQLCAVAWCCLALAGCGDWILDTEWESDGYRLVATDPMSQMTLISEDAGIFLVPFTVYAVGSDNRFIVLLQHPRVGDFDFDRSITNYYIVEKLEGGYRKRLDGVRGPLTKVEFDERVKELSLSELSTIFDELK